MSHLKRWVRSGLHNPGRTAFLLLSLSVSLASALAATALNAAVSWRALPFLEAESLVQLRVHKGDGQRRWWSWRELQAIVLNAPPPFHHVAGYTVGDVSIASEPGRPPEALLATMASAEFFRTLGVGVLLGRSFTEAEHLSGGARVVVLSHPLWQRRYGGDPHVVGRTVELSTPEYLGEPGGRHLVIGVLAPETWLFWQRFDLVMPLRASPQMLSDARAPMVEHVVARLAPKATVSAARAHAVALATALRAAGAAEPADTIVVDDLKSALFRDLQPKLHLVLAIALLVLALAGVNVVVAASSAALERQRETALRLALGAAPGRLARDGGVQLALSVAVASVLATVLASAFIAVLVGILPDAWMARVPGGAAAVRVELTGLTALGSAVAALGAIVALSTWAHVRRLALLPLLDVLHTGDAPRRHRWRGILVGAEVALCAAVLLVATAVGLQLLELRSVDLGVTSERTSAFWVNANAPRHADPLLRAQYFDRLSEELRRVPGFEAVGAIDLTFQFDWQTTTVRADTSLDRAPVAVLDRAATPGYLDVSGVRLIDGRWFQLQDRSGAPDVAVISRSLAEALWPDQRSIGQTIRFDASKSDRPLTVVGVVSDIRRSPQAQPARVVYRAAGQSSPPWLYFLVRTRPVVGQMSDLQSAILRVDPDQALDGPWTMQEWIDDGTAYVRFLAQLTAMLAGIAIVLAAAGLQALTMYWVEAARGELGIRRAIGASHRDVVAWFARRWVTVVAPALAAGILIQFAMMRTAMSHVEGLQPASLAHLGVGTVAVVLYASAAAGAALMRALRTDGRLLMR